MYAYRPPILSGNNNPMPLLYLQLEEAYETFKVTRKTVTQMQEDWEEARVRFAFAGYTLATWQDEHDRMELGFPHPPFMTKAGLRWSLIDTTPDKPRNYSEDRG